ncbi:MAG: hypothetical protein Q8S00_29690 [Deltaproteobacteria bacterium]|nr:hypothetical protein [Deltaproteobacteria bacterium]MDZ4347411.1 hypothetical protein [Candidatus Binatia bacterium]
MADCLIYWKDCSVELNEFTSDTLGPWNFHYLSKSRYLFDQIERRENLWIVIFDVDPPPGDWLLIERLSVTEKKHRPEFARPYQIVGDPKKSVVFDIRKQSDITDVLHKLNFVTGKTILAGGAKISQSLQTYRPLTSGDSTLLQQYSKDLPTVSRLSEMLPTQI